MDRASNKILVDTEFRSDYAQWLFGQIEYSVDYNVLLTHLYNRTYFWSVSNDDNRAIDGIALRDRFIQETNYGDFDYPEDECSVLEMLFGVAVRINDIVIGIEEGDQSSRWFWELLCNLGLDGYDDAYMREYGRTNIIKEVNIILDRFLDRSYKRNGVGGIFPVKTSRVDQREIEIWYQMSAYLEENYSFENTY